MNIADWLSQSARSWPARPALYHGAEALYSYAEFAAKVQDLAAEFRARGLVAGDRIAVFAPNAPDYLIAMQACWWIGCVLVPINYKLHPKEAEWILEHSGASLVLTGSGAVFEGIAERALGAPLTAVDPATHCPPFAARTDDLAWLFYTSGTTGRPKGVMLSHGNLAQMTQCYFTDVDRPEPSDHMLYAAPISHGAGLYSLAQMRAGAAHLVPQSGGFDCAEIEDLARSLGGLTFFAAPTMVKRLIAHGTKTGWRGEGIRTIVYGGGPMYAADIDEALALFGPRFVQIYGQGESPMTITALSRELLQDESHPDWRARRVSVGVAQTMVDLSIRSPDDAPLPAGETGEISVRGPSVMLGYWQNEKASAETLKGGWLHTGDLGYLTEDGFLHLTDRSKDVIISGGTNIYPREVEEVLLRHPSVFEVAVIGAPDAEWGENVVAFVVLSDGAALDRAALDLWCRDHIAAFKRPKLYVEMSALPKNSYGKILKTELRLHDLNG